METVLRIVIKKELDRFNNEFYAKEWFVVQQRYLFFIWTERDRFDSLRLLESWISAVSKIENIRVIR